MAARFGHVLSPRILLVVCLLGTGCESLHEAGLPGMGRFVDYESRIREEEEFRRQYQTERSPAAMQWLLANRLRSGMSRVEVEHVFGEQGERQFSDVWLKTNGGHYRSGDTIYKWGPDNNGQSVYLAFRENKLVNFDPDEYRDPLLGKF